MQSISTVFRTFNMEIIGTLDSSSIEILTILSNVAGEENLNTEVVSHILPFLLPYTHQKGRMKASAASNLILARSTGIPGYNTNTIAS
jgi:hypothetical protein